MQDSRRKHYKVTADLYFDTPTRLYCGLDTAQTGDAPIRSENCQCAVPPPSLFHGITVRRAGIERRPCSRRTNVQRAAAAANAGLFAAREVTRRLEALAGCPTSPPVRSSPPAPVDGGDKSLTVYTSINNS